MASAAPGVCSRGVAVLHKQVIIQGGAFRYKFAIDIVAIPVRYDFDNLRHKVVHLVRSLRGRLIAIVWNQCHNSIIVNRACGLFIDGYCNGYSYCAGLDVQIFPDNRTPVVNTAIVCRDKGHIVREPVGDRLDCSID